MRGPRSKVSRVAGARNVRTAARKRKYEDEIDEMSNDGRLTALAMSMAIDAGADWPSLNGEAQDQWHERAIEKLRGQEPTR